MVPLEGKNTTLIATDEKNPTPIPPPPGRLPHRVNLMTRSDLKLFVNKMAGSTKILAVPPLE